MSYDAKYYAAARQIRAFFMGKGFTHEQACGWVANASAESSLSASAIGDKGHAFGAFQLHSDRCELIRDGGQGMKGCGIDIMTLPDLKTQLEAVAFELNHSEKHARDKIMWTTTPYDAGYAICHFYERPGAPGQAEKRGQGAEKWAEWFKANP
jgi:hypothetical protein